MVWGQIRGPGDQPAIFMFGGLLRVLKDQQIFSCLGGWGLASRTWASTQARASRLGPVLFSHAFDFHMLLFASSFLHCFGFCYCKLNLHALCSFCILLYMLASCLEPASRFEPRLDLHTGPDLWTWACFVSHTFDFRSPDFSCFRNVKTTFMQKQ